jgi:integrase
MFFTEIKKEKKLKQNTLCAYFHGAKKYLQNYFLDNPNKELEDIYKLHLDTVKQKQDAANVTGSDVFKPNEINELCLLANKRYRDIIKFLVTTGVRVSEAVTIKLSDCRILNNEVVIIKIRHGKNNKSREIVASTELYHSIRLSHEGKIYLFESTPCNPCKINTIEKYFNKLSKKTGKRLTPHLLRHSYVTNHLDNKTDLKVLSLLAGARPEQLLRTYHHPIINYSEIVRISNQGIILKKEKGT